ncbi:hypothetical protein MHYP_G00178260 [Metynnis hypsauchen]
MAVAAILCQCLQFLPSTGPSDDLAEADNPCVTKLGRESRDPFISSLSLPGFLLLHPSQLAPRLGPKSTGEEGGTGAPREKDRKE